MVAGPHLDLDHLFNDVSDGPQVRAHPIGSPVHDVELAHQWAPGLSCGVEM